MSHLSEILESFKSVNVCTYIVNDFDLKRVLRSNKESEDIFQFQIQLKYYALKLSFCVQCYKVPFFSIAYYSVNGDSLCEDMIGKIRPADHRLASRGLPSDDKR